MEGVEEMPNEGRIPTAVLRRLILSSVLFFVVLFAALFLPAGDIRWAKGWLFILALLGLMVLAGAYLWRVNPDIFIARSKIHDGTKGWDKVLVSVLLLSYMAEFPVAAFDDGRFHWSNAPLWVVAFGYVSLCLGFFVITWVEKVNKFAEPGVRIHAEQKVIDTGPYAIVRHPMYLGAIPYFVGTALALGSYWALIPAAIATLILVPRTMMEDKSLHEELEGYKEYAARVRCRLIPIIW
jgi:protein-S-isoprenylcysteine O-methyltransferase Ste14